MTRRMAASVCGLLLGRYSTVSHEVDVSKWSRVMAVALFKVAAKTPKHRRSRQKMHMAR